MNQITPTKTNSTAPLVTNELSRGELPDRLQWDTPEEEESFVTDATEVFLQVQSAAHKKLPAWAQRAAENQNDGDIRDLSRTISTSPATLALQAQVLRWLLEDIVPKGTCDRTLLNSLARGLALLSGHREDVVCGAELQRQLDVLEHTRHLGSRRGLTDERSEELTDAEDAALAAIAAAPAANHAQFARKLEVLLELSSSNPVYTAAPASRDALVDGIRSDVQRLLR